MCLANMFGDPIAQIDRIIESLHPDKRDIAKADEEVLKRVLCGATDAKDFEYLTERLKQVKP